MRGTSVTLTNSTGDTVEVRPATANGGMGSYAALAPDASQSESDPDTNENGVSFYVKRSNGGVAAVKFTNPIIGYPNTTTCVSDSATGCDSDESFVVATNFSEGEEQQVTAKDSSKQVVMTLTVKRGSDTDDYKNWTASLTQLG